MKQKRDLIVVQTLILVFLRSAARNTSEASVARNAQIVNMRQSGALLQHLFFHII